MCQRTTGEYSIESVYPLVILPSIKGLIGGYDWVDPRFKPLAFHASFKLPTPVRVGLMYFGSGVYVQDMDVRRVARQDGLRLLDVAGLLSLGNQYLDLQFSHSIVSLDPLWVDEERHCHAVYLRAGPPGRCVKLYQVWLGWTGGYRFAVILP